MDTPPESLPSANETITLQDRARGFARGGAIAAAILVPEEVFYELAVNPQPSVTRGAIYAGAGTLLFGAIGAKFADRSWDYKRAIDKLLGSGEPLTDNAAYESKDVLDWPDVDTIVSTNAPTQVELIEDENGAEVCVFIEDASLASFDGEILKHRNGTVELEVWNLDVDKDYRERGLATRVTSALIRTAIEQGATRLTGNATSAYTLKIFKKLCKEKRITVSEWLGGPDVKLDDAISRLEKDPIEEEGFSFRVKLPKNANKFEKPIPYTELED